MITELERAKNTYAIINTRMKVAGLSKKERGFLKGMLAKAKETLRQAYQTTPAQAELEHALNKEESDRASSAAAKVGLTLETDMREG